MYPKIAVEEDKMEMLAKDAEGIIIFVSPQLTFHTTLRIKSKIIDWIILCHCRGIVRGGGRQAKPTGYIHILSRAHL